MKFKASTSPFNLWRRKRISMIPSLILVPKKIFQTLLLAFCCFWNNVCMLDHLLHGELGNGSFEGQV